MDKKDLEDKYSAVIGEAVPPNMREGLEAELVSSLRQELQDNNTLQQHYMGGRLHCWKIVDGNGRTKGEFSTYQWDSGQIDSLLTFTWED